MSVLLWPNGRPVALKMELVYWIVRFNELLREENEREGKS